VPDRFCRSGKFGKVARVATQQRFVLRLREAREVWLADTREETAQISLKNLLNVRRQLRMIFQALLSGGYPK
jgi:hypothetical protein